MKHNNKYSLPYVKELIENASVLFENGKKLVMELDCTNRLTNESAGGSSFLLQLSAKEKAELQEKKADSFHISMLTKKGQLRISDAIPIAVLMKGGA